MDEIIKANRHRRLQQEQQINASFGIDIEKGRKMPIGTISNGRKKVGEGKWVLIHNTKPVSFINVKKALKTIKGFSLNDPMAAFASSSSSKHKTFTRLELTKNTGNISNHVQLTKQIISCLSKSFKGHDFSIHVNKSDSNPNPGTGYIPGESAVELMITVSKQQYSMYSKKQPPKNEIKQEDYFGTKNSSITAQGIF